MNESPNLHVENGRPSDSSVGQHGSVDLSGIHAAVQREKADPVVTDTPMPLWLTVFCGWILVLGGVYLGMFSGGFSSRVFDESAGLPGAANEGAKTENAAPLTLAQQGKSVFLANCASCHQPTGMGLPGQYPPLAGSEWVLGDQKRLVAIILKGLQGPVVVKGAQFNGAMPTWEPILSDKKIAAVASYIRQEWGNKADEIKPETVAALRQEFSARKEPWRQADIEQIHDTAGATSGSAAAPSK